jgi:hypothetical protein
MRLIRLIRLIRLRLLKILVEVEVAVVVAVEVEVVVAVVCLVGPILGARRALRIQADTAAAASTTSSALMRLAFDLLAGFRSLLALLAVAVTFALSINQSNAIKTSACEIMINEMGEMGECWL